MNVLKMRDIQVLDSWLLIVTVTFFIIGYLLYYLQIPQMFFINTSITSFFYYLLGNIYSEKIKKISLINHWWSGLLGIVMLLGSSVIYMLSNSSIFYRNNELKAEAYIVIIVALLCILGILGISFFITRIKVLSKILEYFGINSLVILCTHLFILKLIQLFDFSNVVNFCLVTICMIPSIYILKRFFPKLSGYQPLFKVKDK